MKKSVIFSEVVPVYNDQVRLEKCLKSSKRQTLTEYFEILVIDIGSDEDIKGVTDEFAVVLYLTENKPGSYAARNKGIDHASAHYIAFTDTDCIPSET